MFRLLTLFAAVAVLVYRSSRRGKRSDQAPGLGASLQTWEGEGGGVPVSQVRTLAQAPAGEHGRVGRVIGTLH
jgi:hypothetical protein